jgi:hypothetical protein
MTTLESYRQFGKIYADSTPIRSEQELDAAIVAAGLHPEDVTKKWLRSLRRPWVYGESDMPFVSDRLNRQYLRMLCEAA